MILAYAAMIVLSATQAFARPDSFADLAERLSPAVVNISTTTIVRSGGGNRDLPQFPEGSPFEDFFKDFGDRDQTRRAQSLGSGFIIDEAGIVVTKRMLSRMQNKSRYILRMKKTYEAEVIGRDAKTDIAVLRFDPKGDEITAVEFGNSDDASCW